MIHELRPLHVKLLGGQRSGIGAKHQYERFRKGGFRQAIPVLQAPFLGALEVAYDIQAQQVVPGVVSEVVVDDQMNLRPIHARDQPTSGSKLIPGCIANDTSCQTQCIVYDVPLVRRPTGGAAWSAPRGRAS